MQHHKYSLTELENMMPWEREIYMGLLMQWIKEENERLEKEKQKARSFEKKSSDCGRNAKRQKCSSNIGLRSYFNKTAGKGKSLKKKFFICHMCTYINYNIEAPVCEMCLQKRK